MELKKKLGKRIQDLRLKNNLKQSELAERVGIATKHQSCIETGKNYPSAELIEKYAREFRIDVSDVFKIDYIKDAKTLTQEIISLVEQASDNDKLLIYKILKDILF